MDFLVKLFNDNPKFKALSFSLLWLLMLLVFTYTPLFSAMIHVNGSVMVEYFKMESQMIAMIVNFGLVFMLVIDSWGTNQYQEIWQQILNYLSFFLVIGIYWHSQYCQQGLNDNLEFFLSWKGCSLVMHFVLLIILLVSKSCSVYRSYDLEYDKAQVEFE